MTAPASTAAALALVVAACTPPGALRDDARAPGPSIVRVTVDSRDDPAAGFPADAAVPLHSERVVAFAVSPSGRYLATGSWGADVAPHGTGSIIIWDVAAARPHHAFAVDGGVGWPDRADAIAWSADERRLVFTFGTNRVGVRAAFGPGAIASADVTDGWDEPPAVALAPDGARALVECHPAGHAVPGCLVPLDGLKPVRPMAEALSPELAAKLPRPDALYETRGLWRWLPGGERVLAGGATAWQIPFGHALPLYAIDVASGALAWFEVGDAPMATSPDGRLVADDGNALVLRDAATGAVVVRTGEPPGVDVLVFAPALVDPGGAGAPTTRLAAIVDVHADLATPEVRILDDGKRRYVVPARAQRGTNDGFLAWAFAPDGRRGAVLGDSGQLELWSLPSGDAAPSKLAEVAAPPWRTSAGLAWALADRLMIIAPDHVRFVDDHGQTLADYAFDVR